MIHTSVIHESHIRHPSVIHESHNLPPSPGTPAAPVTQPRRDSRSPPSPTACSYASSMSQWPGSPTTCRLAVGGWCWQLAVGGWWLAVGRTPARPSTPPHSYLNPTSLLPYSCLPPPTPHNNMATPTMHHPPPAPTHGCPPLQACPPTPPPGTWHCRPAWWPMADHTETSVGSWLRACSKQRTAWPPAEREGGFGVEDWDARLFGHLREVGLAVMGGWGLPLQGPELSFMVK